MDSRVGWGWGAAERTPRVRVALSSVNFAEAKCGSPWQPVERSAGLPPSCWLVSRVACVRAGSRLGFCSRLGFFFLRWWPAKLDLGYNIGAGSWAGCFVWLCQ